MIGRVRLLACAASLLALTGCQTTTRAAECPFTADEVALWPEAAATPGIVERTTERSSDPARRDRIITGVTRPSIYPYLAPRPNGAAALVIPGGGYRHVTFDKEGVDIATWLNTLGVSAFVLKYRSPSDFPGQPELALEDARRALGLLSRHAQSCRLDAARLGVVGFSAGGHLASQLATRADLAPRPAFAVLLYPVISMDATIAHAGSRSALVGANPAARDVQRYSSELQVSRTTSPTFIAVSKQDRSVDPENSLRFAAALKTAGVEGELHVYADGGHGTGIRDATGDMAAWPEQAANWLEARQFLR